MNVTAVTILEDVRDAMTEDQWCQGSFQDDDGRRCLGGWVEYRMRIRWHHAIQQGGDCHRVIQAGNEAFELLEAECVPEGHRWVSELNDGTDWETVQLVLKRAIHAGLADA